MPRPTHAQDCLAGCSAAVGHTSRGSTKVLAEPGKVPTGFVVGELVYERAGYVILNGGCGSLSGVGDDGTVRIACGDENDYPSGTRVSNS